MDEVRATLISELVRVLDKAYEAELNLELSDRTKAIWDAAYDGRADELERLLTDADRCDVNGISPFRQKVRDVIKEARLEPFWLLTREEIQDSVIDGLEPLLVGTDDNDIDRHASDRTMGVRQKAFNVVKDELRYGLHIYEVHAWHRDPPINFMTLKDRNDCMRLFLDNDLVDINVRDNKGLTALMWAILKRKTDCVRLLLNNEQVDVNVADDDGMTALIWAARMGATDCVRLLLNNEQVDVNVGDDDGMTALIKAARMGATDCVRLLLNNEQVDVNVGDDDGMTALIWAVRMGATDCVRLLFDNERVDVNARDDIGLTALIRAAWIGEADCVRLLLNNEQVDVNVGDDDGMTALIWAVRMGATDCVRLLFDNERVDVNARDDDGKTALIWAAGIGATYCVRLLLAVLDKRQFDVNMIDKYGMTALMRAAMNGNDECTESLINTKKANVMMRTRTGDTAFLLAARSPRAKTLRCFLDITFRRLRGEGEGTPQVHANYQIRNANYLFTPIEVQSGTCFIYRPLGLRLTIDGGHRRCVICRLLGDVDSPIFGPVRFACQHPLVETPGHLFCNMERSSAFIVGLDCSKEDKTDYLEYVLQYHRILFHTLVLLFREELSKTRQLSLVLFRKASSLVWDSTQVDCFLQLLCAGSHPETCVDFLLSCFICQMNGNKESLVSKVIDIIIINTDEEEDGQVEMDESNIGIQADENKTMLKLLLENIVILNNDQIYNHLTEVFLKIHKEKPEYLMTFLEARVFYWHWYSSDVTNLRKKEKRMIIREHVIERVPPGKFESEGATMSPLIDAFLDHDSKLIRYLLANLYLTDLDLHLLDDRQVDPDLRDYIREHSAATPELQNLHRQVYCTPWRLEAISLVKVSTLLEGRKGIEERLKEFLIDDMVQRLSFMNPLRTLCITQWQYLGVDFLVNRQTAVRIHDKYFENSHCCDGRPCRKLKHVDDF